jgi:hypothetical protein
MPARDRNPGVDRRGEADRAVAVRRTDRRVLTRPGVARVDAAALPRLPELLRRWLPDGRREGREHVARNPTRHDRRPGSFKVNLATGRWADFATGDKGGGPVSLAAYLFGLTRAEAAARLARTLGLDRPA